MAGPCPAMTMGGTDPFRVVCGFELLPYYGRNELYEGTRAMADGVLVRRIHLAKRHRTAVRHEHRIIAEALVATWRPRRSAIDTPDEGRGIAVRPGEAQRRHEPSPLVGSRAHLAVDPC